MKPKRTILCVDDNEQSLSYRKIMLETRGYRVASYSRGEEALERFKQGGVDLVVTDMAMPGLDGPQLDRRHQESFAPHSGHPDLEQGPRLRSRIASRRLPGQRNVCARRSAGTNPPASGPQARPQANAGTAPATLASPRRSLKCSRGDSRPRLSFERSSKLFASRLIALSIV